MSVRNFTVPGLSFSARHPANDAFSARPVRHTLDRIAILSNSGHTSGDRTHLAALLADNWRANGIEVIDLSGTSAFVEADLLFLNLSRAVIPPDYARFAAQYPVSFNAGADDLRKHRYADGQLKAGAPYRGPVIVRTDLGFAAPPQTSKNRNSLFGWRNSDRSNKPRSQGGSESGNYRIFASINDVPAEYFGPQYIVQKFLPEEKDGRFILRQYYFLGDMHFLSLQTSGAAIIHTGTPMSLEEWAPPQELLTLRERLGLEYGRIDFVQVDGNPFVTSINRSPALPESKEPGYVPPAYIRLGEALSEALVETYAHMEKAVY